jgi:hypothetical protein
MKKIVTIIFFQSAVLMLNAQENYNALKDPAFVGELMKSVAILLVFALIASFIINIIKMILDYRLKNKMLDKGISENLASQFLKTGNNKNEAIKWFAILCGIGVGLVLVAVFPPFGIHSLIIMVFSIAASFLVYYYYANRSNRNQL